MFTTIAIFSFFLTYTLAYKYAISQMLKDLEKRSTRSPTRAKSAIHLG